MRLTLDDLKVAESAARNYPQGGIKWVEGGKSCSADAVSQFNSATGKLVALSYLNEIYYHLAGWSRISPFDHDPDRTNILVYALQANPTWVADCFKQIIDAAEGRNIIRSTPKGMTHELQSEISLAEAVC